MEEFENEPKRDDNDGEGTLEQTERRAPEAILCSTADESVPLTDQTSSEQDATKVNEVEPTESEQTKQRAQFRLSGDDLEARISRKLEADSNTRNRRPARGRRRPRPVTTLVDSTDDPSESLSSAKPAGVDGGDVRYQPGQSLPESVNEQEDNVANDGSTTNGLPLPSKPSVVENITAARREKMGIVSSTAPMPPPHTSTSSVPQSDARPLLLEPSSSSFAVMQTQAVDDIALGTGNGVSIRPSVSNVTDLFQDEEQETPPLQQQEQQLHPSSQDPNNSRVGAYPVEGRALGAPVMRRQRFSMMARQASMFFRNAIASPTSGGEMESPRTRSRRFSVMNFNSNDDSNLAVASIVTDARPVVFGDAVVDRSARNKRRFVCSVVFFIVAIVAIIVAFTVAFTGRAEDDQNKATTVDEVDDILLLESNKTQVQDCLVRHGEEHGVVTSCLCFNNTVSNVPLSSEQRLLYAALLEIVHFDLGWIQQTYDIESCEPPNQALVWLAQTYDSRQYSFDATDLNHVDALGQRFALAVLFLSTDGPSSWNRRDGWLTEPVVCDWYGIVCSFLDRVTSLKLPYNGLNGVLPSQVRLLRFLSKLDLNHNPSLRGPIPNDVGFLASLYDLDVSSCDLTGQVPQDFGNLSNLFAFNLANNQLEGGIPILPEVRILLLGNNSFQSTIPSELGESTSLSWLDLHNNLIDGPIPKEISNLTNLHHLDLSSNTGIAGTLPGFLGLLPNLETISIAETNISGTIPSSFCVNSTGNIPLFIISCGNETNGEATSNLLADHASCPLSILCSDA